MSSLPKISLALPVYNGEKYLEACLVSLLSQTFRDFELVISDNASTDRTAEIIAEFAERDPRIRVIRQVENVGAAENFNLLFHETKAEIFKWCAYDDCLVPEFLEETYSALAAEPNAVISHSQTLIHDLDNDTKEVFVPRFSMPRDDKITRLRQMLLFGTRCYEVFGLIRREALNNTDLIGNYRGGDNVLLYRLALLGPILVVPRPLFILGRHSTQSTVMVQNTAAYQAWFQGRSAKSISFPDWLFVKEIWKIMNGLDFTLSERLRCYGELVGETYRRRRILIRNVRIAVETLLFGSSDPQQRRRFFGSSKT